MGEQLPWPFNRLSQQSALKTVHYTARVPCSKIVQPVKIPLTSMNAHCMLPLFQSSLEGLAKTVEITLCNNRRKCELLDIYMPNSVLSSRDQTSGQRINRSKASS